ncbi:MAG: hypothetical protein R2695_22015 [Acidimicrobiales bacterium]
MIGAKNRRIVVRELLPNVLIPMGGAGPARHGHRHRGRGRAGLPRPLGAEERAGTLSWGKLINEEANRA